MPKAQKLIIPVEADAKAAIRELEKFGIKAKLAGDTATSAFAGMKTKITGVVASLAVLTAAISKSIKLFAEMEQQQIAFEVLTGSQERGQALIDQMVDFARKTPFATREVIAVTKQLMAFGFEAENVMEVLKILGDISAAVGRDKLPFIAKALADTRAKGKLAGQEFIQFANSGLPLIEMIADATGKSVKEVQKLRQESAITYEMVYEGLQKATDAGGRFNNMMDKQNQTFGGQASEFLDNVEYYARILGEVVVKYTGLEQGIRAVNKVLGDLTETEEKDLSIKARWLDMSMKERKEYRDKQLAIKNERIEREKAIKAAERELEIITKRLNRQNEVSQIAGNLRQAKKGTGGFSKVDAKTTDRSLIPDVAETVISQEEKKREAYKRTHDLQVALARSAATFTIEQGQRLMFAADGQSRAMFNIGKTLYLAKTLMAGKQAVIDTYASFGGWPAGVVPAGIMAGIYISEANAIRKMRYNSGSTPRTSTGVNTFSNFTRSPLLNTDNTNALIFQDLNGGLLGIKKEIHDIKRTLQLG